MDIADVVMQAADAQSRRWAEDAAELARWKGKHLLPRAGCKLEWVPLGNASVLAEYELLDDQAMVLSVLINGTVIDAESYLHPRVLEGLESLLWEDHKRGQPLKVAA